jgi:DNA-binding HxlR family transcriptional regulator
MAAPDATATDELRAGSLVLSLFATPLDALILRAHADGPLRLSGLHNKMGWAAHTTLRAAIGTLLEVGALEKVKTGESRLAVENELTAAGREMIFVADVVEDWLAASPDGPIAPDSEAAKGAVKALAGGWSSTLMRALAGRAFTLTELDSMIPVISYPALERRLARMRTTGQIQPVQAEGRGTPYVVTDWLRQAVAPLCAAGRCERRHLPDKSAPITRVEVEAAFMLAIPLVSLPESVGGSCMLAVQTEAGGSESGNRGVAGVSVEVKRGRVVSCAARVVDGPPTWALGTAETWLEVVIEGQLENLRLGGARPQLALDLVTGLHRALFDRFPSR